MYDDKADAPETGRRPKRRCFLSGGVNLANVSRFCDYSWYRRSEESLSRIPHSRGDVSAAIATLDRLVKALGPEI